MGELESSSVDKKMSIKLLISSQMLENYKDAQETLAKKMKREYKCKIALGVVERIPESVLELSGNDWEKMYACFAELLSLLFGSSDCDIIRDIRFLLHNSLMVSLIGENGVTMTNIKTASGVHTKVKSKDAPNSTDRVLQVKGFSAQVLEATKLIYQIVGDKEITSKVIPYNPVNHNPVNVPDYGGYDATDQKEKRLEKKRLEAEDADEEEEPEKIGFRDMELDERIQKAIAKMGWKEPTLIQERGIPLLLDGKDLLARGRTGSGKTGAFSIPLIQRILDIKKKEGSSLSQSVRGVVLCPSRELSRQTTQVLKELASSCIGVIRILDIGAKEVDIIKPLLKELPDIIVSTPGRLAQHIKEGNVELKDSLEYLFVDEADLIFTYGFENDIKYILANLPKIFQAVMTSATLTSDVQRLKQMLCNNPVVLKLLEPDLPDASQLSQYVLKLEDKDKFVFIYALFKLNLIRGKTIIFVSTVDKCYKMKLYLEQFGISVCLLNSELPAASRCHVVSQFNQGVYKILIAADEKFLDTGDQSNSQNNKGKKKKQVINPVASKRKIDKESGAARGIDFLHVSNVINFDFPRDYDSYIHRVGRTARAGHMGSSLSLVAADEQYLLDYVEERLGATGGAGQTMKPYKFNMEELDGFRYRATDAWFQLTRGVIREARLKEIREEMINSQKLTSYFEDNPQDMKLLRHDKNTDIIRKQPQLKNVPDYLIPSGLRKTANENQEQKRKSKKRKFNAGSQRISRKESDPLRFDLGFKRPRN